jgi:MFS family permease
MSVTVPASAPHDGLYGAARYLAMFAVALSVLLSVLDYAVVNVALPSIAEDIHTSDSNAIWVVNAYQLASLIALLPLAAMGDRVGHARMCRIGLMLFVVASLLCAVSRTLPELTAARALQGFGGACIMSVNAALVRFIYPGSVLGRGIALNGLVVALGVALGPTVAAAVLALATWTRGPNTRLWPLAAGAVRSAFGHQWALSVTLTTTPCARASSRHSNASCSRARSSHLRQKRRLPASATSKASTIQSVCIPLSDTSPSSATSSRPLEN